MDTRSKMKIIKYQWLDLSAAARQRRYFIFLSPPNIPGEELKLRGKAGNKYPDLNFESQVPV